MLEHLKLLKELSSFLPLDRGTRILEIGQGELSTLFNQEIDESNVVINLIPLTVEEIGKEEYISDIFSTIIEISKSNQYYDAIVIPDFFNFLSKKKAFELLNLLLKITKESVFILINEFQSKEPLFIPDFKNYDISYYSLDGFCHSLIKIFRKDTLSEIKLYPKVGNYSELPLTIMYVMPHRNLTGGLKMLYEQMKSLQKKGHKIKVIIKGDYPKVVPEWVEGFIPDEEIIIPLYDKYTNYLNDIDIVFAGFYNQISELENNKVPVLYWEQGHEYLYGDFKDKGMEKVIRKSLQNGFKHDIYLATDSSYVHDIVKARFNKDSYILPIFIDTDFYYPIESKLESDPLTILLVGNPALTFKGFQKALWVLMHAWNQGYRFKVEWACQIKPTIEGLPFEILYHENVSQPELANVYRQADILLTCSLYEGCPMPPLEAMASGVAVVATNSGGINQYAKHNVNALISFSNTVEELTELLKVALVDTEKRKSLIKNGHETAISLNYENGSVLLENILLSVVADYKKKPQDKRKKVLFMIGTLLGGGAEKVLCNVVKYLDKSLFDVTVQTVFDQGVYIEDIKQYANYKTIYRSTAASHEEAQMLQNHYQYLGTLSDEDFSKAVIDEEYDIEIAFLEDQSTKIIANSPNKKARKIAWVHANLMTEPGSAQFYKDFHHQKACYELFDDIAFVSHDVKEAFEEKFNIESSYHVLYNPIDATLIRQKAKEKKDKSSKFTMICVGRLIPIKGLDRLLIVHRQLIQEGFDYNLLILGDGVQREVLESFVQEHQLEANTAFLGFQENPYPFIEKADLMVSPSYTEGFSTVLAEALILETPVVATKCAGTKELLGESEYGLMVENDIQKLYEGLRRILTDTILYETYCKKARIRGLLFDLNQSIKEIEQLLLKN